MKSIEIVTHAYAERLPHYAAMLDFQLSSLILYKPACDVRVSVCCTPTDDRVMQSVDFFQNEIPLLVVGMDVPALGRRSIGRNVAAQLTTADLVWFADVDHCFRNGCLDRLASMRWPAGASMVYPKRISIHRDHATGDEVVHRTAEKVNVIDVDESLFVDKFCNRAIGGVQIVEGDFARRHGYLDGQAKWQAPRTDGRPFGDFRDDVAYRRFCRRLGEIKGVDIPGVYRLRHSTTTYQ